jgi:hypothetical protein
MHRQRVTFFVLLCAGILFVLLATPGSVSSAERQTRPAVVEACAPDLADIQKEAEYKLRVRTVNPDSYSSKSSFEDGDLMGVKVTSPKAGYLWVFNLDMYGCVNLLFPNKHETDNDVKAYKPYYVGCGEEREFQIRIGAPEKGREFIFAVLSTGRNDFIADIETLIQSDFPPQVSDDCENFIDKHTRPCYVESAPAKYGFGYCEMNLKP